MALNLIGGLAAADGYLRERERQQDRDYLTRQRDYQNAQMQAGLDTLPAEAEARRQRLSLDSAKSAAGLELLPGQTANAVARQGLESDTIAFDQKEQPILQDTQAAKNRYASQNIEGDNASAQNMKANERQMAAFNAFGEALEADDKSGALQVANQWASTEALRQGTRGKNFVDIVAATDGGDDKKQNVFRLVAEDGSTFDLPAAAVKAVRSRRATGDYMLHQGRAGDITVLNKKTGRTETVREPSETYARNTGASSNKPAKIQIAELLKADNPNLTMTQALQMANTSMEKPRHQAILELMAKTSTGSPDEDPSAMYKKWAKVYDKATADGTNAQRAAAAGTKPSNTVPNPMLSTDQKFDTLFE